MVSLCSTLIRNLKRQERGLSSSMMKSEFLMFRSARWSGAGWWPRKIPIKTITSCLLRESSPCVSVHFSRILSFRLPCGLAAIRWLLLPAAFSLCLRPMPALRLLEGRGNWGWKDTNSFAADSPSPELADASWMMKGCAGPHGRALGRFRIPLKFKLSKVFFQVMASTLGAH